MVAAMERIIDTGGLDGESVDYLDGVVFSADESYLCIGMQTSVPGPVSDYTGQDIYYRSIQHEAGIKEDRLTIHDYFWRWDTDWFWCSRSFGAQNPRLRRWWPRRYRRSSVYWRLMALDQRFGIADRFENSRVVPRVNGWCRISKCRSNGPASFWSGSGKRAHFANLVVPVAATRSRRLAAVPDPA